MSESEPKKDPPPLPEAPEEATESAGVWESVKDFFRYYRDNKGVMCGFSVETNMVLESTGSRQAEIRILHDEKIGKTAWDGKSWNLQLMDSCVVCGGESDTDWIDETQEVQDVRYAVWAVMSGFFGGALIALGCFSLLWSPIVFVVSLLIGMVVGYRLRRTVSVRLRYRRDSRHASDTQVPSVAVFPNQLLLRVGSREAKQKFVQYNQDSAVPTPGYQPAAPSHDTIGPHRPESTPQPEEALPPIPFDDDDDS